MAEDVRDSGLTLTRAALLRGFFLGNDVIIAGRGTAGGSPVFHRRCRRMRALAAWLLCAFLTFHVPCFSQSLDNPVLGQADALLRAGKAEEAWDLLAPLEARH